MSTHWHSGIDNMILYGISAILVINFTRFGAAALAKQNGTLGTFGRAIGALVQFG